jgi:hypothetical protein
MPGLNDIKKLRCQTSPRARVETVQDRPSATEPDGIGAAEGRSQTPSQPVSTDNICSALAAAAARQANDLVGQRIEHAMNTPSNRIRPPRPIESSQRK